uniref:Bestrophin homolog n=1 Tax=Panagrellus redivivus TaxID=6233 RepID=A0A7E4UYI1_PANRE
MYQDMETASISSAEAMGLAKCLDNSVEYILDYCCCCIFHRTKYDPFLFRAFAIAFEVYTLISTWRLFNYICDVLMDEEMTGKRRFRTTSEIDAEREREIEEAMREPIVETTESDPLLIHEEVGIDEVEDEDVPSD